MNIPHRPCRITILSEYAVARTFFFYRQLLSVMNKNVLRILPRSVVGGLKKKELSRAAASTPFAFPSWFLSDSTSGCESVEGACWHCCSPAGTHRASSPLPCQWASVCTFRPVTASYTTPIVTIPQFRKQPEVASLPHSLLPSLRLLVHLPLSVFPKDVTASLSL